jgi:hypothetical protein
VVRPGHGDVVDLVLAVAQLHDATTSYDAESASRSALGRAGWWPPQ